MGMNEASTSRRLALLGVAGAVLGLGLAGITGVPVMGFFKSQVLFSPVEGVVTLHGKPVAGAEIVQELTWAAKEAPAGARALTDGAGRFSLPVIEGSSMAARMLPLQPSMTQRILIRHEGQEYIAYRHHKTNYDLNGERGGKPLTLICELTAEPKRGDGFYGICRFG